MNDTSMELLPQRLLRRCRMPAVAQPDGKPRSKLVDSSGLALSGRRLLTAALVLKRVLARKYLAQDEQHVGVLLPPSVGGALANVSLTLMRRVAINLNYTLSADGLNHCIRAAEIKHVLTSRQVIDKLGVKLDAEPIFIEDLKAEATKLDKAVGAFQANVLPLSLLERQLGLHKIQKDDLLTIVFTSGSTGEPKGVMLTHGNIASNTAAIAEAVNIRNADVLLGILPFFHSFGYTATLWLPLTQPPAAVYHYNPLDAREIGRLAEKHGMTILMSAPTFLRSFIKRVKPEQFSHLNLVVVGAEKLPADLNESFRERFGVECSEGYGTTELSPVVSVNVPPDRATSTRGSKFGSVGQTLPGITAKVIDPDTGTTRPTGEEGLLLISGPNVMAGYFKQPDKTAELISDGWYNTGDFARLDEQGYIEITGRQSRFSKIGGEMVPHLRVEEILQKAVTQAELPTGGETDEQPAAEPESIAALADVKLVVTSVPDAKKGERLIVLHRELQKISREDLLKTLESAGIPNLWIPDRDAFFQVEDIPMLGSGKLDLKSIKELAAECVSR